MTITYGSILEMRVRKVKSNPRDCTLSIPSAILPGLNADFDGDILNSFNLPLEELWEIFADFSPMAMMINRTTGSIKFDMSGQENITVAIFSDR